MTQLKRDIIKKVTINKDTPASAAPFVNLYRSILVRGLDDIEVIPQRVDWDSFNPMFDDFITVTDIERTNGIEVTDGALFRIARDGDRFIGSIFVKGLLRHMPDRYNYITSFVFSATGVDFKYFAPNLKNAMSSSSEGFIQSIMRILYAASTYTPQLINPDNPLPKKLFYNKLSNSEKELYKEYTIDISKPRVMTQAKTTPSNAEPTLRAEHERRGHWRTSKFGKKYFVRQTTVNKGAVRKIVKDYKV